jgi:hypothetical protein
MILAYDTPHYDQPYMFIEVVRLVGTMVSYTNTHTYTWIKYVQR